MRYTALVLFVGFGLGSSWLVREVSSTLESDTAVAALAETEVVPPPSLSKVRPAGGFKVAIPADPSGHYFANAVVNGHSLRVVVDTGASDVALSEETARRLGLKFDQLRFTIPVSTANGMAFAAEATLAEVRVGSITVRDVSAIVMPGEALDVNLLGMSFLNRLRKFEVGGGPLVLVN